MHDTTDIGTTENYYTNDVFELAEYWYSILLADTTVRAHNVLDAYQQKFASTTEFFTSLLNITEPEVMHLRNCGRKTVFEIIWLSHQLREKIGWERITTINSQALNKVLPTVINESPSTTVVLPDIINNLLPLIYEKTNDLTVRARNAIRLFIQGRNNSIQNFYDVISAPNFSASKMKNVGPGTVLEVTHFLDDAKSIIEHFSRSITDQSALSELSSSKLIDISIPIKSHDYIWSLNQQLGYFPLFATISAYLDGLNEETKVIIEGCLHIYNGQKGVDRKEIGRQLGISAERVRQKRYTIIDNLTAFFANIRKTGYITENPYNFIMTHPEEYVNATEGTNYSSNFVCWVLGCVFDEVTMIGDVRKPLTSFNTDSPFINIAPTSQCTYFDFNSFVGALNEKLIEKRTDEDRINLKSFMSPFFKVQYYEDYQKDVETSCRSLIYQHYPVEVDMGQIIFKPNSRKNNPDIIEDILRAAGHPMTLDELYNEFTYQYPERSVMYNSFRGNIGNNPNIIPVGRSSTYSLIEWQNGDYRGGTIREFVSEFLNSISNHIATVEAIGEYVRQFRPNSGNESIVSNLKQDKTQKYAVYIRDGQRYIGYRNCEYDLSFTLLDLEKVSKRSTEESMKLLIEFIIEHKHFPLYQPNNPEETQLYRFVDNMRSSSIRGKMEQETEIIWNNFCKEYWIYKLSRKEAKEIDLISLKIHEFLNTLDWPYGFRSISEIVGQALDYYVQVFDKYDKDEKIRPFLMSAEVNGHPIGYHLITCIIDRYVFNTKRSLTWNGKEWISEDVLRLFEYDDESINKQALLQEQYKSLKNNYV